MNWILKLLGYRDREYRSGDFCVRIESVMREGVSVVHTRDGASLKLRGERIGRKWNAIEIHIPQDVEAERLPQIAHDLEIALKSVGYGYVIAQLRGTDVVPETERQAAISELRQIGYEIELSNDEKGISQTRLTGRPRLDLETARNQALRMSSLMQSVQGRRHRLVVLAKSKQFFPPEVDDRNA